MPIQKQVVSGPNAQGIAHLLWEGGLAFGGHFDFQHAVNMTLTALPVNTIVRHGYLTYKCQFFSSPNSPGISSMMRMTTAFISASFFT
jgi:hypothetical protein